MKKTSIWKDDADKSCFVELLQDTEVDVAIIGGGITGITTGYLLAKAGKKVAVLESWRVGGGTTGYSTGNLYSIIDEQYHKIQSKFNTETIKRVAASRIQAIDLIERIIKEHNLDCDFHRTSWHLISETEEDDKMIEKEYQACLDAGLNAQLERTSVLPFKTRLTLKIDGQAQFNPAQYIKQFAPIVEKAGCMIYEHTKVTKIEEGDPHLLHTEKGKVRARHIVHATHSPKGVMFIQTLLGPYREYALSVKLRSSTYPEGIFWAFNKPHHHSMRSYKSSEGENHLIILGEPHKVGQKENNEESFSKIEKYVRERFDVGEITHRWGAQHYKAADGLPYIGRTSSDSTVYIATGYSTDGLTYGTLAAQIITDQITGKENQYSKTYDPSRHNPLKSAADFIKENANVMVQYIKDIPYKAEIEDLAEVGNEEGKTIEVDGEKYGAFRDKEGKLHVVSIVCTHMKCILTWNKGEHSWDCPCHGSRFNYDGQVIEGPAITDLAKMSDKK